MVIITILLILLQLNKVFADNIQLPDSHELSLFSSELHMLGSIIKGEADREAWKPNK